MANVGPCHCGWPTSVDLMPDDDPPTTDASDRGALATAVERWGRGLGRSVDLWQQRHAIIAFPWSVYRKYADDSGGRYAAQLAYYTLFSVAPLLLVFAVLLGRGLQDNPSLRDQVIEYTLGASPEVAAWVTEAVEALPRSSAALALGVIAALFAGLQFTESAQYAFNQIWAVPWRIRPGFLPRQARAISMTLVLYVALVTYGLVMAWVGLADNHSISTRALSAAVMSLLLFVVVLLSYWVLCGRKLTFWQIWPGTLAFIGITILTIPFLSSLFNSLVSDASQIYGALASVIAFLTLTYLTAAIFIFTAEINAVRTWHLWPRALFPDWLSHADRRAYAVLAPVEERMPEQRVITYFGVLTDGLDRELGPDLDEDRFSFVDSPPPFLLDDPQTVLMQHYVEGREPDVVPEAHDGSQG